MNDQVKTADGYNFGGTSYKNEERTDSQGNKYSVAIPISSVLSQAPQAQFQTPTPQTPVNYNSMTSDIATPYDFAVQNYQQNQVNASSDVSNLMNTLSGKSAFESQTNEALGLNKANEEYIKKAAEISALGKKAAEAQQENISQGRQLGSVGSFVAGQGAEIERNRAIKALSLGAELDAIQGNVEVAKSKVKQVVDAQYADKELALANKLKMFELNQSILGNLTSQQQKSFEQAKYKVEQEQKRLDEEKETKKDISNIGLTLRKYGVSDSVVKDVLGSSSINDALIKAGNNLQDPQAKLELQSLKADIALKYAQIAKTNREAQLSKEPTATENKAQALAVTQAKASAQAAQDKIDAVNTALNYNAGISARVGTNIFSRGIVAPIVGGAVAGVGAGPLGALAGGVAAGSTGIKSSLTGQGQQLSGTVHQLTSGLTLQNLIDAKKNGATFGALSDGERQLLASSATKLNDWEIKDKNGVGTGYWNVDEKSFRTELKTIQDLSKKALLQSQGTLISPDENTQLDSMFQDTNNSAGDYFN